MMGRLNAALCKARYPADFKSIGLKMTVAFNMQVNLNIRSSSEDAARLVSIPPMFLHVIAKQLYSLRQYQFKSLRHCKFKSHQRIPEHPSAPPVMERESGYQDSRESRLLSLPPEIRNLIYRYALVEGEINIGHPHVLPTLPGALQVNKQVRSETLDIYYKENVFVWYIDQFNADALTQWCLSSWDRYFAQMSFALTVYRKVSWTNVLRWLRAYYDFEVIGITPPEWRPSPVINAVDRLFAAVESWRKQGLNWEAIEENLEMMHSVLAEVDENWA